MSAVIRIMSLDEMGLCEMVSIMIMESIILVISHEVIYSYGDRTRSLSFKGFCALYTIL